MIEAIPPKCRSRRDPGYFPAPAQKISSNESKHRANAATRKNGMERKPSAAESFIVFNQVRPLRLTKLPLRWLPDRFIKFEIRF